MGRWVTGLGWFGNNLIPQVRPKLRRWNAMMAKGRMDRTEQRRQAGTETKRATQTNERRTHSAWLICEGDHDLSFPTSVGQFVPLFLWCAHIVEIWCEPDSTHVDIVAHVVRDAITAAFRFVGAEVTLKRDFRVSRNVAGTSHALVPNYNNRWDGRSETHNVA